MEERQSRTRVDEEFGERFRGISRWSSRLVADSERADGKEGSGNAIRTVWRTVLDQAGKG
jgi:hypothetical protein